MIDLSASNEISQKKEHSKTFSHISQDNGENNENRSSDIYDGVNTDEQLDPIKEMNCSNISIIANQNLLNSQVDTKHFETETLLFLLKVYAFCETCKGYYTIKIQDLNHIIAECRCKYIYNCTPSYFIQNYLYTGNEEKAISFCKSHFGHSIIKYCWDCKKNLCEECLKVLSIHNNVSGIHKKHETHTLIDLKKDVKKYEEEVKKILAQNEVIDDRNNLKFIIECLIKNYEEFPTYGGYKTLKKLSKGLILNESTANDLEPKEFVKINSIKELKNYLENKGDPEKIYKIIINEDKPTDTMENLSIFKEKSFTNLKVLILNKIKLKDISALKTCEFPKLRRLDFESNELTNSCIQVFNGFKLPVIKFFSLFDNKITSTEVFEIVKNYKNLKTFFIGKNKFIDNQLVPAVKYELPHDLEELGITNNFTEDTLSFIFNYLTNLENLTILYITGNGFTTLEKLSKIQFTRLIEFWCRGDRKKGVLTNIREIEHLQGKQTIEKIVLKENDINNIEELKNIIEQFPKLKELNLENNGIDESKIKETLEAIKRIKGYENFIIKY